MKNSKTKVYLKPVNSMEKRLTEFLDHDCWSLAVSMAIL
jgi:hypothetical protein